jgi:hypothetical protein
MSRARVAFVASAVVCLAATAGRAQEDPCGEFTAHGDNIVRIEDEAKLRVPEDQVEQVWNWLVEHYRDCSWLDRDGRHFTTTLGDEHFADTYFDEPGLRMLDTNSGVRHRRRVVVSGSATRKDGRALLQIKLNRDDPTGLARTEIKYKVDPPEQARTQDDLSPMIGLVARDERPALKQRFADLGIDPYAMRPVLTVGQVRRRVYVADAGGAFATLTLDQCTVNDYGTDLHWTEIELELNEIRYTEVGEAERKWMKGVQQSIQDDLLAKWPGIVQDQTPKYTKAFVALEAATWLPMRTMIRWQLSPTEMWGALYGSAAAGITALLLSLRWWLRRRAALAVRTANARRAA